MVTFGRVKGAFPGGKKMVIVESISLHETLDLESLVVFPDGRVLGRVSDVFGPVSQPFYTVQLAVHHFRRQEDTDEDEDENDVSASFTGCDCCFLPSDSTFVDKAGILRHKGCDASNAYDEEIPDDELEFSDDEAEISNKRNRRRNKRKVGQTEPNDAPDANDSDDYVILTRPSAATK